MSEYVPDNYDQYKEYELESEKQWRKILKEELEIKENERQWGTK